MDKKGERERPPFCNVGGGMGTNPRYKNGALRRKHRGRLKAMGGNPRHKNGNARRKIRARIKAMGAECGICKGRLGPIHYDEPSNSNHPLSFVVDEIIPISRYKEFGYESKTAAALDWNNVQAAHYICNQQKSNKLQTEMFRAKTVNVSDGEW